MWFGPMNLQIANELPRGMKGIVVTDIYKYCNVQFVSCTILVNKLESHDIYKDYPFTATLIRDHILKCGKSQIVISLLSNKTACTRMEEDLLMPYQSKGDSVFLSSNI